MTTTSLHGFVIHKTRSGESSSYVNIFTKEYGMINALYKGGQTVQKQIQLRQFTPCWLDFNIKNDRFFLNKLEVIGSTYDLSGKSLFSSLYINELLYYLLPPLDVNNKIFITYIECLQALEGTTELRLIEITLRKFEKILLSELGYEVLFTLDINTNKSILDNSYYKYIPGHGFIEDATGVAAKYLFEIQSGNFSNPIALKIYKNIMRLAIDKALDGKEIRTRKLFINLQPCSRII
ncbi:MAG: DNA repair protein RecO [Legionellales bacterium RIFCSPHIGHO2_12_FULL_35_11]|nr:MAG: DNA repair protein RecO [Legionellales bacterium RIFCSPHIGHO2_12_FULL_35_11]